MTMTSINVFEHIILVAGERDLTKSFSHSVFVEGAIEVDGGQVKLESTHPLAKIHSATNGSKEQNKMSKKPFST